MHVCEVKLTKEALTQLVSGGLTKPQMEALKEQQARQIESGVLPCEKES